MEKIKFVKEERYGMDTTRTTSKTQQAQVQGWSAGREKSCHAETDGRWT